MIRILQLDSGGAKGVIIMTILRELEKKIGRPVCEIFDLIVGSSAGAIYGGILANGSMSAVDIDELMIENIKQLFKRRLVIPLIQPLYNRKPFIDVFEANFGKEILMKDCKTKFMCTAVNKMDERTHFFKSWEEKDGNLLLMKAILRSFAAPFYFGSIKDKVNQEVWLDGATGNATCTLLETLIEAMRQKWMGSSEGVHILSLGNGFVDAKNSYKEACSWGDIGDVSLYLSIADGGLARKQSVRPRIELLNQIEKSFDRFSFQRLDVAIPKKMNKMDGIKYIKNYQEFGMQLSEKLELYNFRGSK